MPLRFLGRAANVVAGIILLLMAGMTLGDVLGRNLFNSPIPGATELTEIALVAVTFLLYPQIAYRQTHISIDLLDNLMGVAAQRVQQFVGNALGATVFAAMARRLWISAGRTMSYGDVTPFLRLELGPVIYFMAVMSGITAIAFALVALMAFTARPESLNGRDTAAMGLE
jgi:TRAP-type C4-dicarboxylate transport system permease small subunit